VPKLYFQNNRSTTTQAGVNSLADASLLTRAFSSNRSNTSGFNLSGQIVYRHRFGTPGRTISIDLNAAKNRKEGSGAQQSLAEYFAAQANPDDTVDQQSTLLTTGSSVSTRLVYTEPVFENSQLQVTYNPSYSRNNSDNRKFAFDSLAGTYSALVNSLSNMYDNNYTTHSASLGYRLRGTDFNFMMDAAFQKATLRGNQVFPFSGSVEKTFYNVLPSAQMNYRFSDRTNLRVNYRTTTRPPTISQLQNVVDNTNPLLLSSGNPDLKQSYTHTLMSRYGGANPREAQSLFALFALSVTNDYIANAAVTALRDTIVNRVRLSPGTQLTYPVNLNGYWSLRSFLTYGFPLDVIGSNVNLNGGINYSRTPGIVNGAHNISNNSTLSAGAVVSSSVSEDLDFTLSYTGNYTIARNSLQKEQNSNYFNHTANMKLNVMFWEGFVFRNETSNILYSGLGGNYDQSYWLWSVSVGKKFMENDRGELRVTVTDLLDQNKSVSRTVTETYIEDSQNQVLGRYVMLTFTYTVR
jgi:hypothetical protein